MSDHAKEASDPGPDMRILAGFVRNKVSAGRTATFMLDKRRVHVIPHTVLDQEIPGLLVCSDRGESLWIEPHSALNALRFQSGGFSLHRAKILVRLFTAIRGTQKHASRGELSKG